MSHQLSTRARTTSWTAQIIAVVILGQALFFKLSGAPETVALFTALGVEPWGRVLTGILELVTVALLLRSSTAFWGGVLGTGLMVGAIGAHLTRLGIVVAGDGGTLFGMAVVTLAATATTAYIRRGTLRAILFGSAPADPLPGPGDANPSRA